jgi:AraC family transcriptional regulator
MYSRIEILAEKKLVGKRLRMNMADNKTQELWKSFMPGRKEIRNSLSNDLFSLQVYEASFDFIHFDPHVQFEKWAAIEVADFKTIPEGMEAYALPGGLYAVFIHKGGPKNGPETFRYIYNTWLPVSGYALDNRPHFEILGDKYRQDDPASEEEIWIPIKPKESGSA